MTWQRGHKRTWRTENDLTGKHYTANNRGKRWRKSEDAYIIGSESSVVEDERIAALTGRTPAAVKNRREKLKKMGLIGD